MSTLMQGILKGKRRRRIALAALPFPEKVRIVEQMREALIHLKQPGGGRTRLGEATMAESVSGPETHRTRSV